MWNEVKLKRKARFVGVHEMTAVTQFALFFAANFSHLFH